MTNKYELGYSTQVTCVEYFDKGKYCVQLDSGENLILYRSEFQQLELKEGRILEPEEYQQILSQIIGKRAKKRALHLLEKRDLTEKELRDKLSNGQYPASCVEDAIAYVYQYHYLDDYRYVLNYIEYRKERYSRLQLQNKLLAKGVNKDVIRRALEEVYTEDESGNIRAILEKRHFSKEDSDPTTRRKIYQYLLRRGYKSSDILREMDTQDIV